MIRLVPGVDVRAEVVEITGTGSDDAETGLQCAAGEDEGYYFAAGTRGGYRLGGLDRQGETVLAEDPTIRIPPPGQIRSLRLICEEDVTGARVWASVNGRVLGMVRDAPGFDRYSHVALMFRSPKAGAEVRYRRRARPSAGTCTRPRAVTPSPGLRARDRARRRRPPDPMGQYVQAFP